MTTTFELMLEVGTKKTKNNELLNDITIFISCVDVLFVFSDVRPVYRTAFYVGSIFTILVQK